MNENQGLISEFDDEPEEGDSIAQLGRGHRAAQVSGADWTTETIISQLRKGNIQLKPRFQRRDAWAVDRKSKFIESLILGLPIPQIVLAESDKERGKFLVLDGKQRLLSLLQFWGLGEGENNSFTLVKLPLRADLNGVNFLKLSSNPDLSADYDELCNRTIRTMVIRDWRDSDFLHTVFLRLNTGSVNLSPQELRQALLPGEFTNYIDDVASESLGLKKVLSINKPDPRMRDIEILARYFAFHFNSSDYPGRMKKFIDDTYSGFNKNWLTIEPKLKQAMIEFEEGVAELSEVFGPKLARKSTTSQFNRAIFDVLIYFYAQDPIRTALSNRRNEVQTEYEGITQTGSQFLMAVESDTAGATNTRTRFTLWADALSSVLGYQVVAPDIPIAKKD